MWNSLFLRRGWILAAGLLGIVAWMSCRQGEKESDVGVKKPLPLARAPILTVAPAPTLAPVAVKPSPATTPTAAATAIPLAQTPAATTAPAEISPEAAAVFREIDRAFSTSRVRRVSIRARMEMYSAVRNYRNRIGVEMWAQFPNLLQVNGVTMTEVNDPETTTGWSSGEIRWGLISDGKKMMVRKGFELGLEAPASLDDVFSEQIELQSWGGDEVINCFLKTRPSDAFKVYLKRARVVSNTTAGIVLELVTQAPPYVAQSKEIPATYDVIHTVTVDPRTMIPWRCLIDMTDLSRRILRRSREKEVPVEKAFVEIVVEKAELNADFSGQDVFTIPKEPPKADEGKSTQPAVLPSAPAAAGKTTGPLVRP